MLTPDGFGPESSANWIIAEIEAEADLQGTPLSGWDKRVLRSKTWDFEESERHLVIASHNYAVHLARSAIERAKEGGAETIEVRNGLVLPQIWEDHYETLYESEFPWLVSVVMQNAFLGNPWAEEDGPWRSPGGAKPSTPDVSKPKPDVSKPKPDVSKPKPDVSKPKATPASVSPPGSGSLASKAHRPAETAKTSMGIVEKVALGVFVAILVFGVFLI